jgi:hypothetical protein
MHADTCEMSVSGQMPKKCSCGYENQDDAVFCRSCGTSLLETRTPSTQLAETSMRAPPSSSVVRQPSGVRSKLSSVVGNIGHLRSGHQLDSESQDGLQPVVEYKKLVSRLEKLTGLNKALEQELRRTKERIDQIEKRATSNAMETDETLRGIRATMTRLLKETDRRLP